MAPARRAALQAGSFAGILRIALFLPALPLLAEDWPQWRGANRDGAWNEALTLDSFPKGGLKIRWRAPVGFGFSSPIVAGGRVYLADCDMAPRPRTSERVHSFDAATGQRLWTYSYEVAYPDWAFVPGQGGGPSATPIVENGRIYSLGTSGQVRCLDARRGEALWERDLGKEYQIRELICRASPLIDGDQLIVFTGAKPGGALISLDKNTGKEIWKALDESASNSSPIVVTAGGKRQLIVWTGESVSSLDPATGKLYWREAMVTSNNDGISTPVFQRDLLLVGGLMLRLAADRPEAAILWPQSRAVSQRVLSNTSTALFQGDHVYSARSSGELVCLEALTGKPLWETEKVTELKSGASIQVNPNRDKVFLSTDRGELIWAQLTPQGYREIGRSHLIEPTTPFMGRKMAWSPPTFANGAVFARNDKELVCASLDGSPPK